MAFVPIGADMVTGILEKTLPILKELRIKLAKKRIDTQIAELTMAALDEIEPYRKELGEKKTKVLVLTMVKKAMAMVTLLVVCGCAKFDRYYYKPDISEEVNSQVEARFFADEVAEAEEDLKKLKEAE